MNRKGSPRHTDNNRRTDLQRVLKRTTYLTNRTVSFYGKESLRHTDETQRMDLQRVLQSTTNLTNWTVSLYCKGSLRHTDNNRRTDLQRVLKSTTNLTNRTVSIYGKGLLRHTDKTQWMDYNVCYRVQQIFLTERSVFIAKGHLGKQTKIDGKISKQRKYLQCVLKSTTNFTNRGVSFLRAFWKAAVYINSRSIITSMNV